MECEANEPSDAVAEIAPPGYPVIEKTQEGEGGKPFACPHFGCDGFTFDTVEECRAHEDDWHSPPYLCSECDTSFAANSALKRHFKSSGHYNWICLEEVCEMKGILFANQSEFVNHALNTPGHEHLSPSEAPHSPVSAKRINYAEIIHVLDGESTSECSSEEEGHMCPEPSCRRYQQVFYSEGEFSRHTESHGHVQAIKYSETLRESGKVVADIMIEQEAAREFRCTAEGCPYFGEKLKTSQSFYHHIQTTQHLHLSSDIIADPTSPTAEIRQKFNQLNLLCDEPECPKYEHQFSNRVNLTKHTKSVVHLKAVSYGQMKRSMTNPTFEGQDNVIMQEREQSVTTAVLPSTPHAWSPFTFAPITPTTAGSASFIELPQVVTPTKHSTKEISLMTPPSSRREENLKKRNIELEEELRQMRGKIERIRMAYKEQISSLFQALGKKQEREWLRDYEA
ncbi:hypothetical protein TARUN_1538 [Trichoderma arundinaceum]|uniref:C2H2-type domain-containing protein n=1 Tax=Trichoderma arundinaceum TaxID=490622 RepID=A0A395NXC5_TRIAR|nr:hypothetical protein TARUN_1538 [Trichoderma arundinaceum]